jgi:hypothetical protein
MPLFPARFEEEMQAHGRVADSLAVRVDPPQASRGISSRRSILDITMSILVRLDLPADMFLGEESRHHRLR